MGASSAKNPWVRLAVVAVWAVAFALVEAMIVVYLRKLFGLQFRLTFLPRDVHYPRAYPGYEQTREAATMVMLLAVGYLAGRIGWQRLAFWLFAFGVWDVFCYVWPWVLLRRPASPGTRDVLFLIPGAERAASSHAVGPALSPAPPQSLKITPSGVGDMVSAVSSLRWKKLGWTTCETIIASTPPTRNAIAMMNGGPMPNQDVPEAELAGL